MELVEDIWHRTGPTVQYVQFGLWCESIFKTPLFFFQQHSELMLILPPLYHVKGSEDI